MKLQPSSYLSFNTIS